MEVEEQGRGGNRIPGCEGSSQQGWWGERVEGDGEGEEESGGWIWVG